jgi:hypothetical protein
MRKSQDFNLSEALNMTALETLRGGLVRNSAERHQFIVTHCATVAALALSTQAPKGLGNPADHIKLVQVFTDAKLPRYAEHARIISPTLKRKGFRTCATWDQALEEGTAIVATALAGCAPKVKTAADLQAAEERKAARAVQRAAAEKAAEEAASKLRAEELRAEYAKGQAAALSAATIVQAIRAGAFTPAELDAIREALPRETSTDKANAASATLGRLLGTEPAVTAH